MAADNTVLCTADEGNKIINFILDSGATNHLVCGREKYNLQNVKKLENTRIIKVANGE